MNTSNSGQTGSGETLGAFSDELASVVQHTGASVVALQARRSYPSSALIVRPDVVVTAAHTLRREHGIVAIRADGSRADATLLGVDPGTDIALLRANVSLGTPVVFGDASTVRPGNFVVAVARDTDGALAASAGVVARTGGEWRTWRGGRLDRLVQLDGGLWPGFSGSPVVDARGGVIGIGTSALSRGRAVVIPGSVIMRVADQLLTRGRVTEAYIGAAVQPVDIPDSLRAQLDIAYTQGLIVISTVSGGPADSVGIGLGDILVTLNGKPLADIDDLKSALTTDLIGKPVTVSLIRGRSIVSAEVVLAERPRGH
jgi:S1-C subfamily serine protease